MMNDKLKCTVAHPSKEKRKKHNPPPSEKKTPHVPMKLKKKHVEIRKIFNLH